jgi:DNA-binding response OmpR family regulator
MSAQKIVIDLGQCDPDHASIKRVVEGFGVTVVRAHSREDAKRYLGEGNVALILVNRVLDADGSDGMALIQEFSQSGSVPVMLVSNYPEYQVKAVEIGAVPGFGKAALRDPATSELLRKTLAG